MAIKLTGCLVRGEGGFILINSPFEPSFDSAKTSHIEPTAVGTSGNYADTFYWLDGDRGLGKNVGHQVEVVGYVRNIKNGDLTVDRKDNWTEMTVKSDGRTMKARVPNSSVVASGGSGHDEHKADVIVKRLDVDKVKMTSAGCR